MKLIRLIFSVSKLKAITAAMCLLSTCSIAQKAALDTLLKQFDKYRTTLPTEKLYVHTAQDVFLTGETLWLKLYLVDGALHHPDGISKVAYVEILDTDNRPVVQAKVALQNGFGNGSLFLPASILSGNYTLRAYTNWMKNFSSDFYFHKPVTIINTFKKLDLDKKKTVAKPDAQFFPEGGNLVSGLRSTVAFRVTNSFNKGVVFKGAIVDQDNDTVASFTPHKAGIGKFEFTPATGRIYRAIIVDEQNQRHSYTLPATLEHGYVMHMTDSTSDLITISLTGKLAVAPALPVIYVLVHARNVVSVASMHFLQNGKVNVIIPKSTLAEGISHITVFDSQLQPICERLYFRPITQMLNVTAQVSQREFGMRRKVILDIATHDVRQQPQVSNVSVSVYRVDSLQQKAAGDIFNYLWLRSDLTGTPELTADLLTKTDPEATLALDNVMLTHGWRRFAWKNILTDHPYYGAFVPEYHGHIIRGHVTDLYGKPANVVRTFLSAPGLNIQVYGSTSNINGDVQYEMKDFSGSRRIVVQTNIAKDSTSHIEILSPFSDKYSTRIPTPFSLTKNVEKTVLARSVGMQVQDIFYQDKGAQSRSVVIDTTAFYGKADATYYLDDYTRFPVMEEVMREYVPGVMVRKRKDGFHFFNLDVVNKGVFDEDPFTMLDGIPIFDIDQIMAFDPLKVKKLEVVTRRYYMGVISMPGVVSYTTYAGDLGGFQLDPKCVVLDYEGLQLQREFYTPKYETAKQRDSRMPDQRGLMFWAPQVVTDKEGKQHLEFFTSDLVGEYQVLIEGLTPKGLVGSGTTSFFVRTFEN